MSKVSIKVDASNLKEMMVNFSKVTGKSIGEIVRSHARICAVELANRTQLFSVGSGGGKPKLEQYKGYLRKDLLKIAKDKNAIDERAESIRSESLKEGIKRAIASGNAGRIGDMFKNAKIIKDASHVQNKTGKSLHDIHKQHRSKRTGRALSTSPFYNYAPKGFDAFVNKVSKNLGYTKGGWSECARKIGGIKGDGARGIPAWAKRKDTNNGKVEDRSGDKTDPHFTMTNTTPWVSRLLKRGEQAEAGDIARKKMIKCMNAVFRHVSKNGKNVEVVTQSEISKSNE